ncbi:MAG TPA: M20/M25/M40 family metallo-hydrolase [Candidatus Butyricicoccus stercorigallinarum]|nr:M20/M25/M40 family metallo-hydrolase [Candidatus Butyricicoccus stercorigallinarum]
MNFDFYKAFRTLSAAFGPSGREHDIAQAITEMIADTVPHIGDWAHHTDAMHNLIYHRPGSGKKVLLAAHMDSIGVVVTHIDDNGFARFAPVGGLMPGDLIDCRVRFANGTRGVISFEEKTAYKDLGLDNLFLDIGANGRAQAEASVQVGDFAVFDGEPFAQGDILCGPYLDNRIGCLTLIAAMAQLEDVPCDLYVAFTAQEEVGLRGAQTAAFAIQPDYAIAVDVTDTGDLPERKYPMAVRLGAGPAVKVMDRSVICDGDVKQALYRAAARADIPVQREIMEFGGTDTGVIQRTAGGVKAGAVSIPTRYVHSPNEMASLSDVARAAALLARAVSEGFEA